MANTHPRITKVCETCEKSFEVFPFRKDIARFCSHPCYAKTVHLQKKTKKWYEAMKNQTPWNKGKEWSKEMRKKLSEGQKERYKDGVAWNKGNKGFMAGEKHYRWKGDNSKRAEIKRLRGLQEWKDWREFVFQRDNYTCVLCGNGGELHSHHIKSATDFFKSVVDPDNGVTVCVICHNLVHSDRQLKEAGWYTRKDNK